MRNIYSGSTGLDTPITPKLCQVKPWNWVCILAALLLLTSFWITDPQLGHAQNSVPVKPTGLTATAGNNQITLTWDDPSDNSITGYEYRLRAQVAKLTASDGATGDYFGDSVAVHGDTIVIGTPQDNDNGNDSGSAYVYVRQSGVWSQAAKLTASDGATGDWFGESIAVDGDTVVVGAPRDADNGTNTGSAYVFTKPAAGWTTTSSFAAKLTASDGATGDYFGKSIAVDGDTVVVGAGGNDNNGSNAGSAYVFTKPANGWTTTSTAAKLTASDGADYDWFGESVAVDGDTVVVGAYGDADNGTNTGSAYVFTKPAAGWTTTSSFAAKLTASDGTTNDWFGKSIAVDGDTVVVGALLDADNGRNSGSAYVFTKPGTGWTTTSSFAAKLTASGGATNDYFGISVAVDGDTVVVGAYGDAYIGIDTGSAYVFTKPGTGWTTTSSFAAKLTASDKATGDRFGKSVAVDANTIVIGAPQDDDKGAVSGSAYVYAVTVWTAIPNSAATETNATSYTVTGLTNDVQYRFWIRATNDVGTGPPSDPATVTPTNTIPTAVDDTSSTDEDTAVDTNVISNDTDADGDTLSVTAVTTPSNGTAAITSGSATTVTYTPNANFNGTDTFEYTVTDGADTDTGTVNVTVTAVNDPPVAVDDTASTPEDTAIDINVISNDTDAEGDTLSVTAGDHPNQAAPQPS